MNHEPFINGTPGLRSVPLFSSMVRAVQLYVNDAGECDPAASMGSTGIGIFGDSTEISMGKSMEEWMGFYKGKSTPETHGFLPSN